MPPTSGCPAGCSASPSPPSAPPTTSPPRSRPRRATSSSSATAAQRYAERFADLRGVEVAHDVCGHPDARALVELARAKAMREEFVPSSMIQPLYLREPDARVNFSVRDREIEPR